MIFKEKELEILVRVQANGDFTVQSNSREKFRVLHALKGVVMQLAGELGILQAKPRADRPALVLDRNHVGHFGRGA